MFVEPENYKDDPSILDEKIANLSLEEHAAFDFGLVVCLLSVLEDIQDCKNRCLSKAVITPKKAAKMELLSRVHLLDVLEDHYQERVKILTAGLESSYLPL